MVDNNIDKTVDAFRTVISYSGSSSGGQPNVFSISLRTDRMQFQSAVSKRRTSDMITAVMTVDSGLTDVLEALHNREQLFCFITESGVQGTVYKWVVTEIQYKH